MIIAIDFDGTIVHDDFPNIGPLQPYAKEVINRLHDAGHYIIIWTSRNGNSLIDAINYLLEHGVSFDRINDSEPGNRSQYMHDTRKIYADTYIDDRNLGGFPGWVSVEQLLLNMD